MATTTEDADTANLRRVYEIDQTVSIIKNGNLRKIALQFPDELLHVSASVVAQLNQTCQTNNIDPLPSFFILADTTYGSCCVDEIAADHVNADLIVHYGHSCLSRNVRISTQHVFGQHPLDIDQAFTAITSYFTDSKPSLLLHFDTVFNYAADEISNRLKEAGWDLTVSKISTFWDASTSEGGENGMLRSNRTPYRKLHFPEGKSLEDYALLYVGEETLALTNVIMSHSKNKVFSYSPGNNMMREETPKVNRLLAKRYALIQQAKEASVIGIVVGTLGLADYQPLIVDLKRLIISAGKKPYVIAVGKPNVAKLGNFLEVEVFVLVACPENLLIDSREFMTPIITPFELDASINRPEEWLNEYVLDLSDIRARVSSSIESEDLTR
ncbi:Diphthamide synthesis DPH1/DPH2 [Chytridium lagenaria]|nr:Diphthamide synthesis DPH1/DPH2 [Chytridium lagenaria]